MKFIWCDTETTGLKPENAAPFQVAFIFVETKGKDVLHEEEKVFYLNPFDIPGIEYNEDAGKVHGYSRQTIESFENSSKVVKSIDEFLDLSVNLDKEKMFFCGYNGKFDYEHLCSLFSYYKLDFGKYFYPNLVDVFEQVKKAGYMKVLPYLPNRKLTTIAEYLKVDLSNAHDALGDIRATREVAKSLSAMGVKLG